MRTDVLAKTTLIEILANLQIDSRYLNSIVEGDLEFTLELLSLFWEDNYPYLVAAKQALARQDFLEVSTCAHKLKGSSAILQARRIHLLVQTLEETIAARQIEATRCTLDELTVCLDQLRQCLLTSSLPPTPLSP